MQTNVPAKLVICCSIVWCFIGNYRATKKGEEKIWIRMDNFTRHKLFLLVCCETIIRSKSHRVWRAPNLAIMQNDKANFILWTKRDNSPSFMKEKMNIKHHGWRPVYFFPNIVEKKKTSNWSNWYCNINNQLYIQLQS